ncbi:MAG: hypothetical protein ACPGVJ_07640, partial [Mangrovicoccus sp.]
TSNNSGAAEPDSSSWAIYARQYTAPSAGMPSSAVAAEFLVNTTTSGEQYRPDVAYFSDGRFVVVWEDRSSNDGRYYGVYAQMFNADGTPDGAEFIVNETWWDYQSDPKLVVLPDDSFVVVFYDDESTEPYGGRIGIWGQHYDQNGERIDGAFFIPGPVNYSEASPEVALLANGNFAVTWSSSGQDGDNQGVYTRIFGSTPVAAVSEAPQISWLETAVTFDEQDVNAALQQIDGSVGLADSDTSDFQGGSLRVEYLVATYPNSQFAPHDEETQDLLGILDGQGITVLGSDIFYDGVLFAQISASEDGQAGQALQIDFVGPAPRAAVEQLIEQLGYGNVSDDPEASRKIYLTLRDGAGGESATKEVTITVTPVDDLTHAFSTEQQVNTYGAYQQDDAAIATLRVTDGAPANGYVIVWRSSYQDNAGSDYGIYGQRYDANGVPQGGEFKISSSIYGNQNDPAVAGIENGGFIVVWTDENGLDGANNGVFMQRYDALGQLVGNETRVNTTTANNQDEPQITRLADGAAVITWSGYDSSVGRDRIY